MPSTQNIQIELPSDLIEIVRSKVRSGEYKTESEVVRDGLMSMIERE